MNIWQLIKEDFGEPKRQDPAYKYFIEMFFNYPGVWAIINHRLAHACYNNNFKRLARVISGINRLFTGVDIHPAAKVGRRVFLDHATGIVIGETAEIGDECLIYQGVTLGGVSLDKGKRHPTLQKGAVIGAGAKILGNITIGEASKIGSNSVVISDVPPFSTAVGIPARVLNQYDKAKLSHNKLPNITKELFVYMLKRIEKLENEASINKDENLEKNYKSYLDSLNN